MDTRPCPSSVAIHWLVPYAHVADVERSLAFYEQLGLVRGDTVRGSTGRVVWGSLHRAVPAGNARGAAQLFVALSIEPIDAARQAVLFYLHTDDVRGLREHLLACGVRDAGKFAGGARFTGGTRSTGGTGFTGDAGVRDPHGVLFELTHPHYMQSGELRVHDPDGYCLLIGQPAD